MALRTMYPRFVAETEAWPPDLLVSVFATGAAAAARYQREHAPKVRTVVVMTDSYAHRLWVHEGTDLFLVTSHLAACSVRRYRPRARVEVVSAPARPEFYDAPPKAVARDALGVPQDAACVLLMSGAWGIGPLDEAAAGLARAGYLGAGRGREQRQAGQTAAGGGGHASREWWPSGSPTACPS